MCLIMNDLRNEIEITSRLPYITNEKARKVAEFLLDYMHKDYKEVYSNGTIYVPMYRVLDALSMIDQEKIQYLEG